jgi:hypothetical protein
MVINNGQEFGEQEETGKEYSESSQKQTDFGE